jgi:hypothetical protein
VPELDNDEAMVYEDFFIAGLCMPPYPVLTDILLHFQAQLHQLMPNAITQLSKYFWAVGSFGVCLWGMHLQNRASCFISRRLWKPKREIELCNMDA